MKVKKLFILLFIASLITCSCGNNTNSSAGVTKSSGYESYSNEGNIEVLFNKKYDDKEGASKDEICDELRKTYKSRYSRIYIDSHNVNRNDEGTPVMDYIQARYTYDDGKNNYVNYSFQMSFMYWYASDVWTPSTNLRAEDLTFDLSGLNETYWKLEYSDEEFSFLRDALSGAPFDFAYNSGQKSLLYIKLKNMEQLYHTDDIDRLSSLFSFASDLPVAEAVFVQGNRIYQLKDVFGGGNFSTSYGSIHLSLGSKTGTMMDDHYALGTINIHGEDEPFGDSTAESSKEEYEQALNGAATGIQEQDSSLDVADHDQDKASEDEIDNDIDRIKEWDGKNESANMSSNVDVANDQVDQGVNANAEQTGLNADYMRYSGYYYDTYTYETNISISLNPLKADGGVGTVLITSQYDNGIESNEYTVYLDNTGIWRDVVDNTEYVFRYVDKYNDKRYLIASTYEGKMVIQDASEYKIAYWLEKE